MVDVSEILLYSVIMSHFLDKTMSVGFAVYVLTDPYDNSVRWVGCTSAPGRRLQQHLTLQTNARAWIESLRPDEPTMRVLCVVETQKEGERVEKAYGLLAKRRGEPLISIPGVKGGRPTYGVLTMPAWVGRDVDRLKKPESKEAAKARRAEVRRRIEQGARMSEIDK